MIKLTDNFSIRRSRDDRCWELVEGFKGHDDSNRLISRSTRYYTDLSYLLDAATNYEVGLRSDEVETISGLVDLYRETRSRIEQVLKVLPATVPTSDHGSEQKWI